MGNTHYVRDLQMVSTNDSALVGGKAAALGDMISTMAAQQIPVPHGFVLTIKAYRYMMQQNDLEGQVTALLTSITDYEDQRQVHHVSERIRAAMYQVDISLDLIQELYKAYDALSNQYGEHQLPVVVRSSATVEDSPHASFAGQLESYVYVVGHEALLEACKRCMSSLFTPRAIIYRHERGIPLERCAVAVCVQKMIRADQGASGVIFTIDPETGFHESITVNAVYGLGEGMVQGTINPDQYMVYKKKLGADYAIIQKLVGEKQQKITIDASRRETSVQETSEEERRTFVLQDTEILELVRMSLNIEKHFSRGSDVAIPLDIEWAKDGIDQRLYIVQVRPETVHGGKKLVQFERYQLSAVANAHTIVARGQSIGQRIVQGTARVVKQRQQMDTCKKGDILVTATTDPDWVAIMKIAGAIVTDTGGRTCHAAIVSRELGIPAIIGTGNGTQCIKDGDMLTVDCSQGSVGIIYRGAVPFTKQVVDLHEVPHLPCQLLVTMADPSASFATSMLPVAGVGLARLEFIITNAIGIHPSAALCMDRITDDAMRQAIQVKAAAYADVKTFFLEMLAQGIAMIAAAFYPRPVIVRLSDFKSNEYRGLLGGTFFEPQEENPMLGLRGASRYLHNHYAADFLLECTALKKVRQSMGFTNVHLMLPFVRTVKEAEATVDLLQQHGLIRGEKNLLLYMMVEIPANVLLIEQFARYFDGFSIGSNDLTQLTLGVDRDSAALAALFDERDEAVKMLIQQAIAGAHTAKKKIGICGQAPSDYPEFAQFLIDAKIDSLSLQADAIVPFLMRYQNN